MRLCKRSVSSPAKKTLNFIILYAYKGHTQAGTQGTGIHTETWEHRHMQTDTDTQADDMYAHTQVPADKHTEAKECSCEESHLRSLTPLLYRGGNCRLHQ